MRTIIVFAALAGVAAIAATPAQARINQREAHQQQRIARGVATGQLTARETYRLERQEGRIAAYVARSRADGGGLSARERVRIAHMQDRESRRIYRQRHDAQGN
jgi:membrane protein implicated in regulation of membrane protease activity